jgi:hypothetical protein
MSKYGKIAQVPIKEAIKQYKSNELERGKGYSHVFNKEQSDVLDLSSARKKSAKAVFSPKK